MSDGDLRLLLARAMHKGYWQGEPSIYAAVPDNDAEILEDWRGEVDEILAALASAKKVVADATDARCSSCDHLTSIHQPEGCWYTVTIGTTDRDLVCPCTLPLSAVTES